jgi:hypothetical protein
LAGILILAGCGQSAPHQTVTGLLIRVGGPLGPSQQQNRLPLPGTVFAQNVAGGQFTATTGSNGRFQLSLPAGSYRLTGHSPQVMVDGQPELCSAAETVQVTRRRPVRDIWVVCSIP